MSSPRMIKGIQEALSIHVMAKYGKIKEREFSRSPVLFLHCGILLYKLFFSARSAKIISL